MKTINEIRTAITESKEHSAWDKGVKAYALDLLDSFEDLTEYAETYGEQLPEFNEKTLLNGAKDWSAYSHDGCSLIFDDDIAKRLPASNNEQDWLNVQAKALYQASRFIFSIA